MSNFIFKKKVLLDVLCQDIIDIFEESCNKSNEIIIPKQSKKWEKIELILYKELLNYIYKYKNNLIVYNDDNELKMDLIQNLNKELYTKYFKIQKYINNTPDFLYIKSHHSNPNRYNILKFIFCLNITNCEIIINNHIEKLDIGDLLLFPNNIPYKIKIPILKHQYLIYGEIAYIEANL